MATIKADATFSSVQPIDNADGSITLLCDLVATFPEGSKPIQLRIQLSRGEATTFGDLLKAHAAQPPASTTRN